MFDPHHNSNFLQNIGVSDTYCEPLNILRTFDNFYTYFHVVREMQFHSYVSLSVISLLKKTCINSATATNAIYPRKNVYMRVRCECSTMYSNYTFKGNKCTLGTIDF